MFRALSTRGSVHGYDRLVDDPTAGLLEAKLGRSRTTRSPGRLFNMSKKSTPESNFQQHESPFPFPSPGRLRLFNMSKKSTAESPGRWFNTMSKESPKIWRPEANYDEAKKIAKEAKKASKIHPLFSLFEKRSRKKPTAKPEFSRYVQYLKEGGVWDLNSAKPAIV